MHFALLDWLARSDQIDWSRAVVDSCSVRAVCGGDQTGPNPTDRAKRGSKRHLICDGRGVPLAVRLTGANRNDSQEALALVDAIPPLQGARGRPRRRPDSVVGDRGYDAEAIRSGLRTRGILPLLAMRPYQARQRFGNLALGRRADICVAQSVSTPSCPLRQAGRHSRSVPLARLCASLLAVAAQDVEDRLSRSALSSSHRQVAVGGCGVRRCSGFRSRDPESIDPAALQRIYCTCGPTSKGARRIAPEKRPVQRVRGAARSVRVRVDGGVPGRCAVGSSLRDQPAV